MYATPDNEERRLQSKNQLDVVGTQKRGKKDHLNEMFNLDMRPKTAGSSQQRTIRRGQQSAYDKAHFYDNEF